MGCVDMLIQSRLQRRRKKNPLWNNTSGIDLFSVLVLQGVLIHKKFPQYENKSMHSTTAHHGKLRLPITCTISLLCYWVTLFLLAITVWSRKSVKATLSDADHSAGTEPPRFINIQTQPGSAPHGLELQALTGRGHRHPFPKIPPLPPITQQCVVQMCYLKRKLSDQTLVHLCLTAACLLTLGDRSRIAALRWWNPRALDFQPHA